MVVSLAAVVVILLAASVVIVILVITIVVVVVIAMVVIVIQIFTPFFYEAVVDWIILMSTCFVAGCLLCNHLRFFLCVSIVDCAIKNYAGN